MPIIKFVYVNEEVCLHRKAIAFYDIMYLFSCLMNQFRSHRLNLPLTYWFSLVLSPYSNILILLQGACVPSCKNHWFLTTHLTVMPWIWDKIIPTIKLKHPITIWNGVLYTTLCDGVCHCVFPFQQIFRGTTGHLLKVALNTQDHIKLMDYNNMLKHKNQNAEI